MTADEHVIELLPSHLLGSLEEDEAALVAEHLEFCADCLAELRAYQHVVDALALAVPEFEPPAGLRQAVLQAAMRARPEPEQRPQRGRALPAALLRRAGLVWRVAGLALIVTLALSNLLLWQRLNDLEGSVPAPLRVVPLQGTDFAPRATGLIVVGQEGAVGTLVVDGFPILDEAHEYQLWLIRDGQRVDGGVFSVGDDGYGVLYVHPDDPLISFSGVGVTIEPAGGSAGPTGEKVLGGDL